MHYVTLRRSLLLALCAVLALVTAGCGTLENEVHITYRTPSHTVTKMTLRGGGPMKDVLLSGDLRNVLSRAGWEIGSDDGGDGPATLTAAYENTEGSPFPTTGTGRGRTANPGQALFRTIETTTEETLFTRRITVKFTNEPGALGAPSLADPQGQQVLEALLAAAGLGPPGSSARPQQDNPFSNLNLDRPSFDQMLDAVLKLRVSVTMPGKVVLTNGAFNGTNTVSWRLDASALREAREYYLVSEETLWAKAGAAAAAALMFVAAFALLAAYWVSQRNARRTVIAPVTAAPSDRPDDRYVEQFRPPARPEAATRPEAPDSPPDHNTPDERPPTTP